MNQKKILKDLSANAVQTGISQFVGLAIFYFMSRYISKEDFGSYNWSTAFGSTILAIGSLGLDLVLIKRIAGGEDARLLAGIHFFHTLLIGFCLLTCLILIQVIFPNLLPYQPLFFLVIVQLIVANIANSFKFSLTGLEAFKQLAIVSVCINLIKLSIIILLLIVRIFSIQHILIGFIVASFVELALSYFFVNRRIQSRLRPTIEKTSYKQFVLEALPQLGVVLFDSALARVDWILLGILSTVNITADYSFAYKFFELSKLPLLILAPVLLTRFSRLYNSSEPISAEKQRSVQNFLNIELVISFLIPIFMVCVWSELIDLVTEGKYGIINETSYSILAICVPLHFTINFLWTIGFVQGQLKQILYITIISSVVNILANIILIPRFAGVGAASSFLFSTLIQLIAYFKTINLKKLNITFSSLFILGIIGFISILTSSYIFENVYARAVSACTLYLVSAILTKQLRWSMSKQ